MHSVNIPDSSHGYYGLGLKRSKLWARRVTSTDDRLFFLVFWRTSMPSKPNSSPFLFLGCLWWPGDNFPPWNFAEKKSPRTSIHTAIVDTVNSENMSLGKDGLVHVKDRIEMNVLWCQQKIYIVELLLLLLLLWWWWWWWSKIGPFRGRCWQI